jgi:SAM-dependent methyltransferase
MENKVSGEWYSTWFDSPFYHILYQHRNHEEAEEAVKHLLDFAGVTKGSVVMDLCCGKGRHSVLLEKAGNIVTGLDLSPANIAHCKSFENNHLHFDVHDMRDVYAPGKFDYIFNLFTSFGYFDDEGNEQTLKSIKQSLKTGGKVIIDFLNVIPAITTLPVEETISLNGIDFFIHKYLENNRIYKQIARNAGLDELVIEGIRGHSMRVGAAQDLLNSGAIMPIIMQRGRWSKTDTVMRYVEHGNCTG